MKLEKVLPRESPLRVMKGAESLSFWGAIGLDYK